MQAGYAAIVTRVSDDGAWAKVRYGLTRTPSTWLRVGCPIGLVATVRVGDEVLVIPAPTLENGWIVVWAPAASERVGRKLVSSTDGTIPTQTDPSQPIGGATVEEVLVRE